MWTVAGTTTTVCVAGAIICHRAAATTMLHFEREAEVDNGGNRILATWPARNSEVSALYIKSESRALKFEDASETRRMGCAAPLWP